MSKRASTQVRHGKLRNIIYDRSVRLWNAGIRDYVKQACRDLSRERLELLEQLVTARHEQAIQWAREATHALKTGTQIPTADQLRRAKKEHGGSPLAIWLGILIDGIPESFVIG